MSERERIGCEGIDHGEFCPGCGQLREECLCSGEDSDVMSPPDGFLEEFRAVVAVHEEFDGPKTVTLGQMDWQTIADALGAACDGEAWEPLPYSDERDRLLAIWQALDRMLWPPEKRDALRRIRRKNPDRGEA